MNLHPAVVLAFAVGLGMAFGLGGALIATPAAAFVVAFYREFHLAESTASASEVSEATERILDRKGFENAR